MDKDRISSATILIVDDQEYNIHLLERILSRAGFTRLIPLVDPERIREVVSASKPDIILLDWHMPGVDGMQALGMIRELSGEDHYLPVLVLTADVTSEAKQKALQAGAHDFLTKPVDRTEVILRMNNLLRTRYLHLQLSMQKSTLEERVQQRTIELQQAKLEILQLLGKTSEFRDDMTGRHTLRVGRLSGLIAARLGLPERMTELITMAAPLHDIGKIGIPDELLLKPGRFDPEELERMKAHTTIGYKILEASSFEVLRMAGVIARSHHEKWDGTGYPQGLAGREIPLEARIVALADFYDALTHERPYKKAWTPEEATAEIILQRERHFDPEVVDAYLSLIQETPELIVEEPVT
ncbi:HD-GYP domain-containing protein [Paenibacillus sp. 1P07SE]|uniref:HD-GYP domain-containing protein n=1 Tax=Paenibacillus sp. 1P07SE TaxID=3132209 RepID=UPI0039A526CE